MRKSLTTAALVALATGTIIVGVAGPAAAENNSETPACDQGPKTVVTHLVDRIDSGHHGDWALDTMDRTVTIKKVQAVQPMAAQTAKWSYQAVVTDEGTFVTKGGANLSPNKGTELVAGTNGKISGKFTVDFTAPRCFGGYEGNKGTLSTETGKWVATAWGDDELNITSDLGTNYAWKYTTCSEQWLDAYNNEDGQAAGAGDITGKKPCPTPSATAAPSATAPASTPAGGTAGGGTGALPVTGSNTGILAGVAVVLLALGGGLFMAGRRRRRFTA